MEDSLQEDTMSYGVFTVRSKFTTLRMFYLDFWVRRILCLDYLVRGNFILVSVLRIWTSNIWIFLVQDLSNGLACVYIYILYQIEPLDFS